VSGDHLSAAPRAFIDPPCGDWLTQRLAWISMAACEYSIALAGANARAQAGPSVVLD
jgi:hypothetical protein